MIGAAYMCVRLRTVLAATALVPNSCIQLTAQPPLNSTCIVSGQ